MEVNLPTDSLFQQQFMETMTEYPVTFIAQQYLPPGRESFSDYKTKYVANLLRLVHMNPAFINSHTGKDYFSFQENCELIDIAFSITGQTGIEIFHETHRGRFAFHPNFLIPYLQRYPELKLAADFSHFCTVCETLLEDQEDTLAQIIPFITYIHARIGNTQSPQINDPRASEWTTVVSRFLTWWDLIIEHNNNKGVTEFHICPEFGPFPYMPTTPHQQIPLSDQWNVNLYMKDLLTRRYKHFR